MIAGRRQSTGLPGQGCQDRTARTGCQDRAVKIRLSTQDRYNRTVRAGQKGEDG
jgi:hypothetical protein